MKNKVKNKELIVVIDGIFSEHMGDYEWLYFPRIFGYGFKTPRGIYLRWTSSNDLIEVCRKCGSEFHWIDQCFRRKKLFYGYEFYELDADELEDMRKISDTIYATRTTLGDDQELREIGERMIKEISKWKQVGGKY